MSEKRGSRRAAAKKAVVASEEEVTAKSQHTAKKQKKLDDIEEENEPQPSETENSNGKVENSKRKRGGNKQPKSDSEQEEKPDETEDSSTKVKNSKRKRAGKKQSKSDSDEEQLNETEDGNAKVENSKRKRGGNKQQKSDSEQPDETEDSNENVKNSKRKQAGNKQKSDLERPDETEDSNEKVRNTRRKQPGNKQQKSDSEQEEKPDESDDGSSKVEDDPKRKRAGNKQQKSKSEPPAKAAKTDGKMNKTDSDFNSMDFSSKSETKDGKAWNFKISSWNVSGLRALIKKNGLEFLKHEDPDVFCMQETKCSTNKLPPEAIIDGYHKYWCAADKEGYSGTSLFSKVKPLKVTFGIGDKEHDTEGRAVTAEYDKFYLVNVYVPNSGRGLVTLPKRLKWNQALREYLKKLDAEKPVILCGDLNVAHEEIDLTNPKTNTKNAGFTKEEREGMTELLEDGYVDSFRHLYPDETGAYTFWAYFGNARAKNVGWRLDYFILSKRLVDNICDSVIRSNVYGSDHCPITLLLNMS